MRQIEEILPAVIITAGKVPFNFELLNAQATDVRWGIEIKLETEIDLTSHEVEVDGFRAHKIQKLEDPRGMVWGINFSTGLLAKCHRQSDAPSRFLQHQ